MKTQIVIFGITGDLAGRKLLPALSSIVATGAHDDLEIIGISRRQVDVAQLTANYPNLTDRTSVQTMDLADPVSYQELKKHLDASPADATLFYLSVPPGAAADIVDFLGQAGLTSDRYRVLFEKPFGYDLTSAQEFIERTARYYQESQLYRIDHYMAKEIAAELLRLRTDAETHHHHWDNQSIQTITVAATETIGIEGRAQFYEQTGALRDLVQGHLLQILSLVLMHRPTDEDVPSQRLEALKHLQPADPTQTIRAQYEGYQEEVENPGSLTETLVAMELTSTDPAWQGVEIRVLTGKALDQKRSAVTVTYTDGTEDTFEEAELMNRDGVRLDAYERVLIEAMAGTKAIFTSSPEVLRAWELLTPLQEAWAMDNRPLITYPKGSPIATITLPDTPAVA